MTDASAPEPIQLLTLDRFDRHGTTQARANDEWVSVEHGIPGEQVRAEIIGGKRPRARILEIIEAAPDRVEAPCPYFRDWACGGCQWQHISYEGQIERKREAVNTAMRRAHLSVTVTAVHTLNDPWRYRSTAGISLGKAAGFRRHGSLAIVPIRDCPISHPLIGALMASLNDALDAGRLPNFRGRLRLDVRVAEGDDTARLQVLVRATEREKLPASEELAHVFDVLQSLEHVQGIALQADDGSIQVVSGDLLAPTILMNRRVYLGAASFFQTNLRLLPTLIARLQQEAAPLQGKTVADVYGGVGLFGLYLAGEAERVLVIESDQLAVDAGERTRSAWGAGNVEFVTERAETAREHIEQAYVVVVDPPRSGLAPAVIQGFLESGPPLLLYVSCLAESLARDLVDLLEAGYTLEHLELFDFYPQTYHVELLAVLRR